MAEDLARVALIARDRRDLPGALLPILQAVQEEFGYVPAAAVPVVAEVLNLSRADVYGVLTFYRDLRSEAPAGPIVRLCRAEACQAMGSEDLASRAAIAFEGIAELETVYCLGLCAVAPAAMVAGRPIGRASLESIRTALP